MDHRLTALLFFIAPMFLFCIATSSLADEERKSYIVHMDKSAKPAAFSNHHNWFTSTLSSLSSTDGIEATHLYTYNHVLHGFSAVLSKYQLEQIQSMPGHVATYPETFGYLHTTRTPQFLGLKKNAGLWPASKFGDDIIIGILDTGIWPESESFKDHGMPPVPERWRGACEIGTMFNTSNCNRKLIGARSFSKGLKQAGLTIGSDDYDSPRDYFGHGSHTSSTAAGSKVIGAQYFGYAKGIAMGMAPRARLAMYKVVFSNDTLESAASDTLAGMDQAIEDGVDLMSLSLGFGFDPFFHNPISLGAFAAVEKGIFVACSAANSGPGAYSIMNGAPWITTVGAGTLDRDYSALVTLGKGISTIKGKSVYPENLYISGVPLYYGHGDKYKKYCSNKSLDPKDVTGKIVFCEFNKDSTIAFQRTELNRTGAAGAIIATNSTQSLSPFVFTFPFVAISLGDGEKVKKYFAKTIQPTVDITFQNTVLDAKPAPQVAKFSSRGPDIQSPWILKPDIFAPGVDVLAAWSPNDPFTLAKENRLRTDYILLSGTSMSSPHVVGIAALLKSTHRDWSPAAIRSAMMTTADVTDNTNGVILDITTGKPGTPLDYGAGHVNPNKALDPGLIYDIEAEDYINYLCAINYTRREIAAITRRSDYTCEKATLDLNYPSFMVILNNTDTTSSTFKRVLTNVVDSKAVYRATVWAPSSMKVSIEPSLLTFEGKYSKAEFSVHVNIDLRGYGKQKSYLGNHGYLSWCEVNGKHVVKSPIVSAYALGKSLA
ncbi:hypothetical protein Sjap_017286 [Stephania japonica]|uniref:Uncharacterized protein n=1 Tax=Stephania japonica TaxID=461633 RepID=A0AAP0NLU0_9MAGN